MSTPSVIIVFAPPGSNAAVQPSLAAPPPEPPKERYFEAIDKVASFPHVMASIRSAVSDEAATPPSIARTVERDVAFATRLLRIVNAPEVGLIRPCASVTHAVSLVGMKRIGMLAEAAASRAAIEHCAAVAPDIAERATTFAAIARGLAPLVGAAPEQAFTSALLSDLGTVAILAEEKDRASNPDARISFFGDQFSTTDELINSAVESERERFGFDHMELGADILRRWNMPAPIPEVVAHHHDLVSARECGFEVERLVALVQCAEILAPMVLMLEDAPLPEAIEPLIADHPAFKLLDIDTDRIIAHWPKMRLALHDHPDVLSELADDTTPKKVTPRRQTRGGGARSLLIAAIITIPAAVAAFVLFH